MGTYPGSKDMRIVVFILGKSGEDVDLCRSHGHAWVDAATRLV